MSAVLTRPAAPSTRSASVILCTYDDRRSRWLRESIEGLARQSSPPLEVLVVVDHNPPLARRLAVEHRDVRVLENDGPRGLSGARNAAVGRARGDVLAFLDDDARPETSWLAALHEAFDDPGLIGVGGAVHPLWEAARPTWLPEEFLWVVGCSYTGLPRVKARVRNPIGANMAFRRAAFDATGGFSTGIGRSGANAAGCEETEFAIRAARASGAGCAYVPAAVVRHHVPAARTTLRYFLRRCYEEGTSKALVARNVGAHDALEAERAYATRVLPRAVARGLRETLGGDVSGLARAGAVVLGAAVTAAGYAGGRTRRG